MKDKEKQIEELMKDKEFVKLVRLIEKVQPFYVETIALEIYKKYQPKPKEDKVVLSREELTEKYVPKSFYELAKKVHEERVEELKEMSKQLRQEILTLSQELVNSRKETAEKILRFLKEYLSCMGFSIVKAYFKEQFGVEIKEN